MLERNTAAHDVKGQQNPSQFHGASGADLVSEMTQCAP